MAVVLDAWSRRIVGWSMASTCAPSWWWTPWTWRSPRRQPGAGLIHHIRPRRQGGFNWSSQHLECEVAMGRPRRMGCGTNGRAPMRSPGRPPVGRVRSNSGSGWRSPGALQRGRRRGGGVSAAGGVALVPRGWRHAALSLAPRCRGATCRSPSARRSPSCAPKRRGARDRPAAGPVAVDDLQGAAPQRGDPWRAAGVPGHDRAVARRPARGAPRSPSSPPTTGCALCAGPARRRDQAARRHRRAGAGHAWIGRRHGRRKDRRWATSWSPEQIANRLRGRLPR